jgi:anti-sigma factor RsiW
MSRWDNVDFGDIDCQTFVELVTDYLENQLDDAARDRFEQHITVCPGCADFLDQIRDTQRVLGRVTLDALSTGARNQLMTAFREWRSARPGGAS